MDFSLCKQKVYGLFCAQKNRLPSFPSSTVGEYQIYLWLFALNSKASRKIFYFGKCLSFAKKFFFCKCYSKKISDLKSGCTADQVKQLYKNGFQGGYWLIQRITGGHLG